MTRPALLKPVSAAISALVLTGCGGLIPSASPSASPSTAQSSRAEQSSYRAQASDDWQEPRGTSSRQRGRVSSARPAYTANPRGQSCLGDLGQSGALFTPVPDKYSGPGCNTLGTVKLTALGGDNRQFDVSNLGPVKCELANTFNAWARFGVDRAARSILGSPLARVETMGSYACRNIAGTAQRSAHSRAAAIDVSGFVLKDGRRISVLGDWNNGSGAEREFLRVVHRSACKRFGTVLGPKYNRAHADHFHLEGSGSKFCR